MPEKVRQQATLTLQAIQSRKKPSTALGAHVLGA
jgi:hypothetical protein